MEGKQLPRKARRPVGVRTDNPVLRKSIAIDEEQWFALKDEAARLGVSVSEVIRGAVILYLEDRETA